MLWLILIVLMILIPVVAGVQVWRETQQAARLADTIGVTDEAASG
jgi:hypothetical protein